MGRRHRPFFRINAIEGRNPRDGRILEKLGHYDPLEKDATKQYVLNKERIEYWIGQGADASDTCAQVFKKQLEITCPQYEASQKPSASPQRKPLKMLPTPKRKRPKRPQQQQKPLRKKPQLMPRPLKKPPPQKLLKKKLPLRPPKKRKLLKPLLPKQRKNPQRMMPAKRSLNKYAYRCFDTVPGDV
jgi:small subunit ribosomal protein S16